MTKYFAEGIGTMFLVLLACGSAVLAGPSIGVLGIGLCFGLVLLGLCYAIGNISGCHVNPAVSLAMLFTGRMKAGECAGYIVSQLIGATIGAGLVAARPRGPARRHHRHGSAGRRSAVVLLHLRDSLRYGCQARRRQPGRCCHRSRSRPCEHRGHTRGQLLGEPRTFLRSRTVRQRHGRPVDYDCRSRGGCSACCRMLQGSIRRQEINDIPFSSEKRGPDGPRFFARSSTKRGCRSLYSETVPLVSYARQ